MTPTPRSSLDLLVPLPRKIELRSGAFELGGPGGLAPVEGAAAGAPGAGLPPGTVITPAVQALIDQANQDLADYQRLTAEGKLGEAGLRLESLKQALDQLRKQRRP